jgi:hypothetical protein
MKRDFFLNLVTQSLARMVLSNSHKVSLLHTETDALTLCPVDVIPLRTQQMDIPSATITQCSNLWTCLVGVRRTVRACESGNVYRLGGKACNHGNHGPVGFCSPSPASLRIETSPCWPTSPQNKTTGY